MKKTILPFLLLTIIIEFSRQNVLASTGTCNKKRIFEGRFFGIAKQISLYKKEEKNYASYIESRDKVYQQYLREIQSICRRHRALIYEAKRRNIHYPTISQSHFFQLHQEKMSKVLEKHIEKTGSFEQASISLVDTLKGLGYPVKKNEDVDEIYLRFSRTLESQIQEELRSEQMKKLEIILFDNFDHFSNLYQVNQEVKKIQKILQAPIISSGKKYQQIIEKYNLRTYVQQTSLKRPSEDQIDEQLKWEFIKLAEKNLKKSMTFYVNFVKKVKNPEKKLQDLKGKPETEVNKILSLLYQARINNEHGPLSILQLNINQKHIYTLNMLNNFPGSYSYLKDNCPKLYQAIMLKLGSIKNEILGLPYFSQVQVRWKTIDYNSIYQKALSAFKRNRFHQQREKFYQDHQL